MRFAVASVIFAAAIATSSHAATIYTGTNFRIDVSNPTPVGSALQSVTLTAIGLNGTLPSAFDGTSSGKTGITTSDNSLHQVWEFGAVATPTLNLVDAGSNAQYQPIDTHFLLLSANIVPVSAPTENRPVANAAETPNGGYGNQLTGAFSLSGSAASTWNFAQIVVPAGTVLSMYFAIGATSGEELVGSSDQPLRFQVVPEPSSWLLLVIALGSLLLRGRRLVR